MDTDSLYLALSEENLEDVILPEKRSEWDKLRSKDCSDNFTANATDNFSPERVVIPTRNMIRESRASSKKNLDAQKCCVSVAKHIVVMISILISTNLAAKDSTKEHWKTVAIVDQCQIIAKCWRNLLMQLQPTEDFGRFSIVLLRMNRQRKDYLTFIQKE